jgi:hypothetical protein
MTDLESLAVDLIQLPPRAFPEGWIAVTVDDVAEMLCQARVREPWHNPELGCYSLAQCINLPLGYRSINNAGKMISKERLGRDPGVNDGKPARTKADRARDAIDELRRALPGPIAEFESSVAQSSRWYLSPPSRAQEMRAVQDLPLATERCEILKQVLTLLNSLPPRPKRRAKAWWRLDAAKLWHIYRCTIDVSAGISPGGPAIRFIEAALARMGYRQLPKHIESALDDRVDWRDEFLRRRLDELLI